MTLSRIHALESLGFEWDSRRVATWDATWELRMSELADYHKIHGHCDVPWKYSEDIRLANWVEKQRQQYRLQQKGNRSHMTLSRIYALESFGFVWNDNGNGVAWELRLSELADYRNIHGHCNVRGKYSEDTKLGGWVESQKSSYRLHQEGTVSSLSTLQIRALESMDLEWDSRRATRELRLSELADYRKIHGHSNVPKGYSGNGKLAKWVENQRQQYRLRQEGNTSQMTLSRIYALESLGFEWNNVSVVAWELRFSELADYHKIHGHCNVPWKYSENMKLAKWVESQRNQYKLHVKEKKTHMTTFRIHKLERLNFEWD
jgi:competence protein ComGC